MVLALENKSRFVTVVWPTKGFLHAVLQLKLLSADCTGDDRHAAK
jgi:hypothetical protein